MRDEQIKVVIQTTIYVPAGVDIPAMTTETVAGDQRLQAARAELIALRQELADLRGLEATDRVVADIAAWGGAEPAPEPEPAPQPEPGRRRHRLSRDEVWAIRRFHKLGRLNCWIARRMKLGSATVSRVVKGHSYTAVPAEPERKPVVVEAGRGVVGQTGKE